MYNTGTMTKYIYYLFKWTDVTYILFLVSALELMKNNISLLPTRELETNGGKDEFAGAH